MFKTKPSKRELELLEKAEAIVRRRTAIENKIRQWTDSIEELQKSCLHYHSFYENKGSTGHWDRDDNFWRNYECLDCGKTWTTDQSSEQDKKYPHSMRGQKHGDEWQEYKW